MSGNSFGQLFKITTFGESHGEALGVVIDGMPAGIQINLEELKKELKEELLDSTLFILHERKKIFLKSFLEYLKIKRLELPLLLSLEIRIKEARTITL